MVDMPIDRGSSVVSVDNLANLFIIKENNGREEREVEGGERGRGRRER
jgi:hypothetical protein